jgi:DNA topoisomerase I
VNRTPAQLKPHLSERQFKVYDLIWRRFVASQMAPAIYDMTTVQVLALAPGQPHSLFRATGRALRFDGFLRVWQEPDEKAAPDEDEPQPLPELAANDLLDLLALLPRQHFTQPPSRYTEAALVKALEDRGIGRPSTYASIVATLKDRTYVVLEKRLLLPTPLGTTTCEALVAAFTDLMNYTFTAEVEDWLDEVARGEKNWVMALREFYGPFSEALAQAPVKMGALPRPEGTTARPLRRRAAAKKPRDKTTSKKKPQTSPSVEPGVVCPLCGAPMVRRTSQYGPFLGCSTFPRCKGTRRLPAAEAPLEK